MLDAGTAKTMESTAPAPQATGGFPPFDTKTFPSQLFWLGLTFLFLFLVLWRLVTPRISGIITARRDQINGDVKMADRHRKDAEGASAAYETALAGARARAHKLADENRKRLDEEVGKAKADADGDAHKKMAEADTRIAATRDEAKAHVIRAAQDAAADIVSRLTGDSVSTDEAAAAVQASVGS
jgi:F-type H+-transporting ATPase subunit b